MTSLMDWFRPNRPRVRQVTCDDLSNPIYLRDVRCFSRKLQVPRRRFVCFLVDGVRDAEADLVDAHGKPVEVDYEALEDEKVEMWLKDWFKRPERHVTPRLRIEARERVLAVANLLRLIFPKETESWGQRSRWCSE